MNDETGLAPRTAAPADHPMTGAGARLVRDAARPHLRQPSRRSRTSCRRPAPRPAPRPLRAHRLGPARGRRRRHVGDARAGLREGRRQRLDRLRRIQPGVPPADPRRRGRPALLRHRHLAGRAPAQPARAGGAHEHALHRHHQRLVRRRRRPDAHVPRQRRGQGGRGDLPRRLQGRLRQARPDLLPALQAMVRRILLPAPPQRAARPRRHLLRLARRPHAGQGDRGRLRLHAGCRHGLPRGLPRHRAPPHARTLDRPRNARRSWSAAAATWSST